MINIEKPEINSVTGSDSIVLFTTIFFIPDPPFMQGKRRSAPHFCDKLSFSYMYVNAILVKKAVTFSHLKIEKEMVSHLMYCEAFRRNRRLLFASMLFCFSAGIQPVHKRIAEAGNAHAAENIDDIMLFGEHRRKTDQNCQYQRIGLKSL